MTPDDAGHASPEHSHFALVESLFHEALAQPAECDLRHWLDAQTSDTSIRAEVWSLLEEFERLRGGGGHLTDAAARRGDRARLNSIRYAPEFRAVWNALPKLTLEAPYPGGPALRRR